MGKNVLINLAKPNREQTPVLLLIHLDEVQELFAKLETLDSISSDVKSKFIKNVYSTLCSKAQELWDENQILLVVLATGTVPFDVDPTKQRAIYIPLDPLSTESVFDWVRHQSEFGAFFEAGKFLDPEAKNNFAYETLCKIFHTYGLLPFLLESCIRPQFREFVNNPPGKNSGAWIPTLLERLQNKIVDKTPQYHTQVMSTSPLTLSHLCQCSLLRLPLPPDKRIFLETRELQKCGMVQGNFSQRENFPTMIVPIVELYTIRLDPSPLTNSMKTCVAHLQNLPTAKTSLAQGQLFENVIASAIQFRCVFWLTYVIDKKYEPRSVPLYDTVPWKQIFCEAKYLSGKNNNFLEQSLKLNIETFDASASLLPTMKEQFDPCSIPTTNGIILCCAGQNGVDIILRDD